MKNVDSKKKLTSWLQALSEKGTPRKMERPLVAQLEAMHGRALPAMLAEVLDVLGKVQLPDGFGRGAGDESPEEEWGFFELEAFVASDGERPFEDVVRKDHAYFTGGLGLLQIAIPMVPLLKIQRRDNLMMVLDQGSGHGNPLVILPQESLFDIADPCLWHVADSLDALVERLEAGSSEELLKNVNDEWEEHAWARHRSVMAFIYLWTRIGDEDDSLMEYEWNEVRGLARHESWKAPTETPADSGTAFYALSRTFFFEEDASCRESAELCAASESPLVRDMAVTFGELLRGRERVGDLDVQKLRERIRRLKLELVPTV